MPAKSAGTIQFDYFKTTFRLSHASRTRAWIEKVARLKGARISSLSYVFCTDAYLLKINQDYLNHDTLTDIITFEYTEKGTRQIEGEIYISIPRVRDNARTLSVPFETELHRVMIHGLLHLLGWGDKTNHEKRRMREEEENALALFH